MKQKTTIRSKQTKFEVTLKAILISGYILPIPFLLSLIWLKVDPTSFIMSFICGKLPFAIGMSHSLTIKLISFSLRYLIASILTFECMRITSFALLCVILTVNWFSKAIDYLHKTFEGILKNGRLSDGTHFLHFQKILIPLYAAYNFAGLLGFMATLLASVLHILATFATIRLSNVLPVSVWLGMMNLSWVSFTMEIATFQFAAKFNGKSAELLKYFRGAANQLNHSKITKCIYLRRVRSLPTAGVPIGFWGHTLFICTKSTVIEVLTGISDQTMNVSLL